MSGPSKENFWNPKSAEQVAAEQGITQPQTLDQLTGAASNLWESDEDFQQFLWFLEHERRERASA